MCRPLFSSFLAAPVVFFDVLRDRAGEEGGEIDTGSLLGCCCEELPCCSGSDE